MRASPLVAVVVLALSSLPAFLLRADQLPLDAQELAKLAEKAGHADLRERCYLYARLVRGDIELANRDVADGKSDDALATLKDVQNYAGVIQESLEDHTKKLQDTEILLRESAFRLHAAMMGASLEDRPAMAETLKDVNAAESKVMHEVMAR